MNSAQKLYNRLAVLDNVEDITVDVEIINLMDTVGLITIISDREQLVTTLRAWMLGVQMGPMVIL